MDAPLSAVLNTLVRREWERCVCGRLLRTRRRRVLLVQNGIYFGSESSHEVYFFNFICVDTVAV